MSDALAEVTGLLREAMAGLQTLDARDPEATRAWAARHFAALVAVERALSRASSRPARDDAAIAVHELLVDALRGLAVEDDDPVGAVLGALMRISAARRGFVAVRRPDGALAFPSARSFSDVELGSPEAEVSRTILELAMRGGERPLQVDDASADARFAGQPSVQRLALRAVLVLPLVHAGRAFGVVYLDHPEEGATFDHRRREAAAAFVAAAAPRLEAALASAAAGARPSRLAELRRTHDLSGLVGDDPAVTAVVERLLALAPTDAPALIRGESGAGKRLLARLLHRNSRRARGPWVELRCAADPWAPREALAAARGGTLLLDGVDALPFERQTLLAAEIDRERARDDAARLVATARRGADEALRPELRYRVGAVELTAPPLRERPRDIAALAEHLLAEAATRRGAARPSLRRDALLCLELHDWPGNVRELAHVLDEAALVAGAVVGAEHLPARLRERELLAPSSGAGLKEAVRSFRRRFVERVVREAGPDQKRAAALLGVHPKYLYKLLRDLDEDA